MTDRVTILPNTLPLEVRASWVVRVQWLRRTVEALDAELGLTYPPVRVIPAYLLVQTADGTMGHAPGRVNLASCDEGHRWVVDLGAPALIFYDEDRLLGVLAHEFLHVVDYTLKAYRAVQTRGRGARVNLGRAGYLASWGAYRRLDPTTQASPDQWLSPRLRGVAALAEGDDPGQHDAVLAQVHQHWTAQGLPIEEAFVKWPAANRVELNPQILERARTLHLIE